MSTNRQISTLPLDALQYTAPAQNDQVQSSREHEDSHAVRPERSADVNFLEDENRRLANENETYRRCLLLVKENCDLKFLSVFSAVLSVCDDKLRKFATDLIAAAETGVSRQVSTNPGPDTRSYKQDRTNSLSYGGKFETIDLNELQETDLEITPGGCGRRFESTGADDLQNTGLRSKQGVTSGSYGRRFETIGADELQNTDLSGKQGITSGSYGGKFDTIDINELQETGLSWKQGTIPGHEDHSNRLIQKTPNRDSRSSRNSGSRPNSPKQRVSPRSVTPVQQPPMKFSLNPNPIRIDSRTLSTDLEKSKTNKTILNTSKSKGSSVSKKGRSNKGSHGDSTRSNGGRVEVFRDGTHRTEVSIPKFSELYGDPTKSTGFTESDVFIDSLEDSRKKSQGSQITNRAQPVIKEKMGVSSDSVFHYFEPISQNGDPPSYQTIEDQMVPSFKKDEERESGYGVTQRTMELSLESNTNGEIRDKWMSSQRTSKSPGTMKASVRMSTETNEITCDAAGNRLQENESNKVYIKRPKSLTVESMQPIINTEIRHSSYTGNSREGQQPDREITQDLEMILGSPALTSTPVKALPMSNVTRQDVQTTPPSFHVQSGYAAAQSSKGIYSTDDPRDKTARQHGNLDQSPPSRAFPNNVSGQCSMIGQYPGNDITVAEDVVGKPLASSTPVASKGSGSDKGMNHELLADLIGLRGKDSMKTVQSLLYRPLDSLIGYQPDITKDSIRTMLETRPTKRFVGEIAFQFEKRILEYVFSDVWSKSSRRRRSRFYGFCLANVYQMIEKESRQNGVINENLRQILTQRLHSILDVLKQFSYDLHIHSGFTQDMINKHGLLEGTPHSSVVEAFGLDDPCTLRVLIGQIVQEKAELHHMLIVLDCLCFLAHHDKRPVFLW